jgi:hypothetical protein
MTKIPALHPTLRAGLLEGPLSAYVPVFSFVKLAGSGEPRAGMIEGRLPLVWSVAQLLCDSPSKKSV